MQAALGTRQSSRTHSRTWELSSRSGAKRSRNRGSNGSFCFVSLDSFRQQVACWSAISDMPAYSVESSAFGVFLSLLATIFSSIANIYMKIADNKVRRFQRANSLPFLTRTVKMPVYPRAMLRARRPRRTCASQTTRCFVDSRRIFAEMLPLLPGFRRSLVHLPPRVLTRFRLRGAAASMVADHRVTRRQWYCALIACAAPETYPVPSFPTGSVARLCRLRVRLAVRGRADQLSYDRYVAVPARQVPAAADPVANSLLTLLFLQL